MTHGESFCANCGQRLSGPYCGDCGQKALGEHHWELSHTLHEAWHELVHLDSKIFRTLRLLVRPGALTREYLAGRRAPYVNPIRLFLAVTALFFLLGDVSNFNLRGFRSFSGGQNLEAYLRELGERGGVPMSVMEERFNSKFNKSYSLVMAFLVLGLGGVAMTGNRKRYPYYAQHLVFALHYLSAYFALLLALPAAKGLLGVTGLKQLPLFYALLLPYLGLAVRRVYQPGWWGVAWRTALLAAATLTLNFISIGIAIFAALFLLSL